MTWWDCYPSQKFQQIQKSFQCLWSYYVRHNTNVIKLYLIHEGEQV